MPSSDYSQIRYRQFEFTSLRHAVSGLEHSPGMSAKSPRVEVMCPPHRTRERLDLELCRVTSIFSPWARNSVPMPATWRGQRRVEICGYLRAVGRANLGKTSDATYERRGLLNVQTGRLRTPIDSAE